LLQGKETPDAKKILNDITKIASKKVIFDKKISIRVEEKTEQQDKAKGKEPAEKSNGMIGIDESGKGDYFGPLVVAAVYVDTNTKAILEDAGVMDSKLLTNKEVRKLATIIKKNCEYSIVRFDNENYSQLYNNVKNLNVILGQGHARALENVLNLIHRKCFTGKGQKHSIKTGRKGLIKYRCGSGKYFS